jgi:hypothetical protein
MKKSNDELLTQDPKELDIENVKEGERAIQMDLGLGVFDTLPADASESNDSEALETLKMPGQPESETTGLDLFFQREQSSSDEESSSSEGEEESLPRKRLIEEL